jgi:FtsP/CotA-like multicopper oxidase with cupredoxin domain
VIWLWLACTGAETVDTSTTTDPTTHTHDTGSETPPVFANPPEAEDLDPADDVVHVALTAARLTYEVQGEQVEGYAFDGSVPGPTLRLTRGDTLIVDVTNDLDTDTTVHWHGLHVPYAMDGVTWQQDPIGPGETFTYTFTVDQAAGTYWYHPHVDVDRLVDFGLYGVIVVEDPDEPPVDRELILVLDDWPIFDVPGKDSDTGAEDSDTHDHDHDHGSELGPWTVNGLSQPTLALTAGERVRVRAVNVANTGYADLRGIGTALATDQGLLPAAVEGDSWLLAPGDRVDWSWRPDGSGLSLETASYALAGGAAWGDNEPLVAVTVTGTDAAADLAVWPWPSGEVSADPGTTDLTYVFQGGLHTGEWFINGEQFPDVTVQSLPLGTDAVIEVRNLSASEHPFHLHGHAFEVLSVDGVAPAWRTVEDTVNMPIRSVLRLRLLANNPGFWMTHCHVLSHAHGMMTVLEVSEGR